MCCQGCAIMQGPDITQRDSVSSEGQGGGFSSARKVVHISICVCTFKRPELLEELLRALLQQVTEGKFTYSIHVVDNDGAASARDTVDRLRREQPDGNAYLVEGEQNIALARNRSVAQARGELIAFIDDDEVPINEWLLRMHAALRSEER